METADDPKSQLNQFCQVYCKRPLNKEDIVYTTSKFGTDYQTIVKLNCLGGQEYAGNLRKVVKEAEKEAAVQALAAYATEIELTQALSKDNTKKRKAVPVPTPEELAEKKAKLEAGENPAFTPKVKLNSLCMKIAKRFLQKGETIYKCMNVDGGFQATVQLACLPGEWKDRVWAGHVCNNRQKAEQSAAEIALEQIMEDPEMSAEANKAQAMKGGAGGCGASGKGSGKGWGKAASSGWDDSEGWSGAKGWGKVASSGWDDSEGWFGAKGKGKGQDKGGKGWGGKGWDMDWGMGWGMDWGMDMDWGMWGPPPWMWGGPQAWGEGGGSGRKGGKREAGWKADNPGKIPRHRISDDPMLGEVAEWKGQFGWVKPHSEIEHKAASGHGGKVFVHKSDLTGGVDRLSVGQTVQFFVYEDGSGIGGEDVQIVAG